MKAAIWTAYGAPDVLQLREVDKPTPKDNEVLVKVRASSVTAGDCEVRSMSLLWIIVLPMRLFLGIRRPTRRTILGQEFAGDIEAVGKDVTRYKVGDAIFGGTGFVFGAYAQYLCLPENDADSVIGLKPEALSYEEAAVVTTGAFESLHFLNRANVKAGERLLINGAGGSIGTFGVQLAKHYGAHITAVDRGSKLDKLRDLGADVVIDYLQEDFTQRGDKYDVIFDVVGKSHFGRSLQCLNKGGRYLIANPNLRTLFRGMWANLTGDKQVIQAFSERSDADMQTIIRLLEDGTLKPIVGARYPLEQIVAAHHLVEAGEKWGGLAVTIS